MSKPKNLPPLQLLQPKPIVRHVTVRLPDGFRPPTPTR